MASEGMLGQEGPTRGGRGNRGAVIVPTFKESLQIEILEGNLTQTEEYIEQFTNEKETLGETYSNCQDIVRDEFEKLRNLLTEREELLLAQLKERFEARDDKIESQLNDLQNHANDNEDTDESCKQLLGTMTERKEKKERTEKITKLCQDCIGRSPTLQEVPIDLKHKFKTQDALINSIRNYGELIFKRIESGRKRKFRTKKHEVSVQEYNVGDNAPKSKNRAGRSPMSSMSSAASPKNNKNNNRDDEKEMELEEEDIDENNNNKNGGGGGGGGAVQLPEKAKLVCTVDVNGATKDKTVTLKQAKGDYTFQKLKESLDKSPLVKKYVKEKGGNFEINFDICLGADENTKICNDDDLLQHVLNGADPDEKIALKATLET